MTSVIPHARTASEPTTVPDPWHDVMGAVVESSRDVVILAGPDAVIHYVNGVGRTTLGIDDADLGTLTAFDLAPPGVVVEQAECAQAIATKGWWRGLSWVQPRDGGTPIPFDNVTWLAPGSAPGRAGTLVISLRDARDRLDTEAVLRTAAHEEAQLREQLTVAAEEERRRVAEAIHEEPLQLLASAAMHLDLAERRLTTIGPDAERSLALATRAVREASERLRRLVSDLVPVEVDVSLLDGLGMLVPPMLEGHALAWELEASSDPDLRPHVQSAVLRIVREAVTNVVKHACATTVAVTVDIQDGALQLCVTDDGVGLPVDLRVLPGHLGTASMKERARSLGGTVDLVSAPGSGTTVAIRIPLSAE